MRQGWPSLRCPKCDPSEAVQVREVDVEAEADVDLLADCRRDDDGISQPGKEIQDSKLVEVLQ